MAKRIGNVQTPDYSGVSDIINLRQHKNYVEQDIFPTPDNDVLSGLRFDGSSYLSKVYSTSLNNNIISLSFWVKRSKTSTYEELFNRVLDSNNNWYTKFRFEANGTIDYRSWDNGRLTNAISNNLYRDNSSWYHVLLTVTMMTSVVQAKIYVNGTEVSYSQQTNDGVTGDRITIFNNNTQNLGNVATNIGNGFNGYLANIHFIDGQALDPSYFGYSDRETGQWKPKKYSGTYGSNGFYLPLRGASHKSFDYDLVSNYDNTNISNNKKDVYIASGTATYVNIFRGSKGKFGNSAYSSRNGKIELSADNAYDLRGGTTTFTLEAWIKFSEEDGQYPFIMSTGTGDYNAYSAWYNGNGYYFTGDTTGGAGWDIDANISSGNVYDNTWRHVVYSRNTSGQYKLHVNGTYLGIIATNTNNLTTNNLTTKLLSHYSDSTQSGSAYKTPYVYFDSIRLVKGQDLYGTTNISNYDLDIWNISSTSETYVGSGVNLTGTVSFLLPSSQQISPFSEESGNVNNWTPYGFNNHDSSLDSPQNTFATLNPLLGTSNGTFNNGNLKITTTANGGMYAGSTISIPHTKKWYIEFVLSPTGIVGISKDFTSTNLGTSYGLNEEGRIYINGTDTTGTNTGRSWTSGDIISLVIDPSASSNNLSWYKNGTTSNDLIHQVTYDLTTASFFVITSKYSSNTYINFGQDQTFGGYPNSLASSGGYPDANGIGSFYYEPPEGALALCTRNLPNPDIAKPEEYFKPVLYTGDFPNTKTVNVGFNPDLIWLKSRTQAYNHGLWDTVRTVNGYEQISSNNTGAQATSGDEISFITNGFRVDTGQAYNEAGQGNNNMVAWCWKAGGAPSGDGVAMVDESATTCTALATAASNAGASNVITPTRMSVNTKAGFSIVKYTGNQTAGATVPHGLSSAPDFIIIKNLVSTVYEWETQHKDISLVGAGIHLNNNTAYNSGANDRWNNQRANANVVTLSSNGAVNDSNGFIMYCWHSVDGYSAFGSYTGNGSTDGPFVYTGFKPAWVMIKSIGSGSWSIIDTQRYSFNAYAPDKPLYADKADIESGQYNIGDILSNSFKFRYHDSAYNSPNQTYIYAAFAEQPIGFTNSR